jgi:hypothetical protein
MLGKKDLMRKVNHGFSCAIYPGAYDAMDIGLRVFYGHCIFNLVLLVQRGLWGRLFVVLVKIIGQHPPHVFTNIFLLNIMFG